MGGGEREAVSCQEIVLTELEKLSTLSDPGGGGGGGGTEAAVVGGGGGGGDGCDDGDDGDGGGRRGTTPGDSNLSILSS